MAHGYSLGSQIGRAFGSGVGFVVGGVSGSLLTHTVSGAFAGVIIGVLAVELTFWFYQHPLAIRFSIRDIMLVTLVVALAVGWAAETSRNAPLRRKIKQLEFRFGVVKEELEGRGYKVVPDENGLDLRGPANNWMRSTSFDAPKGTRTMPFPDGPNPPKP